MGSRTPPKAGHLATAVAVAVFGCGPSGSGTPTPDASASNDPRGTDATFDFSWRIDGQDPTLASDPCGAANIRFIRMVFVDANNVDQTYDEFRFDCHLGSYRSPQPELRAGTWRLYWEAVSAAGDRISLAAGTFVNGVYQPTLESVTITAGANVDFDAMNRPDTTFPPSPTNFASGSGPMRVDLTFAAQPGATSGASCGAAGASGIAWTLRRSNGVAADPHDTPATCAAGYGSLQWPTLDYDTYSLDVQGFDATGALTWRGTCANLLDHANGGAPVQYPCLIDRVVGP